MNVWRLTAANTMKKEETEPVPEEGRRRIRITKIFVNRSDALLFSGAKKIRYPRIPGRFAVGLIADEGSATVKQKYIDIPINLKYSIGLGSMAAVFVAAGPQFSFNISGDSFKDAVEKVYNSTIGDEGKVENETFQTSLNVGLGVKLLSKLQIYGGYNFALTDGFSIKSATDQVFNGAGKNNMWKVSVAYLF